MEPLVIAVALLNAVLLVVVLVFLLRRASEAAASAQVYGGLRDDVAQAARLVGEMRGQLVEARSEAREQSERSRAAMAERQAENLRALQEQMTSVVRLTQERLDEVRRSLGESVQGLTENVTRQLTGSSEAISEVRERLGGLSETAKNIQELGKDIASLQDILRAPKLRGNLGEQFLEQSLNLVLPREAFEMQHRFEQGTSSVVVDAVVRVGDKLVPIDSKFPLESFQRLLGGETEGERDRLRKDFVAAVKLRIDEIAERYIRPDAGTYEFALMYLPAETVYYEAVIRDDGVDPSRSVVAYASSKKVIPVSPNTLFAYLLTIAYGLKGMQIEKKAEVIQHELARVQKRFTAFYRSFELVGRHLGNARSKYEEAEKEARTLDVQVASITGTTLDLEDAGTAPSAQLEMPGPEGRNGG